MTSLKNNPSPRHFPYSFLYLLFFFVALSNVSNAFGQDLKPLTLKEAIELSIANSHSLKASYSRTKQAEAAVQSAENNRLPTAGITGSYLRMMQPDINLKIPSLGESDNPGEENKTVMPSVNQAMYGMASVSLPIFAGGKIKYGIESAKYLYEATKLDVENDRESVILNTINAYINLYKAAATVKVVKENVAQSAQRDSVFSRLEENGLLARNDLLKSQLQTSNIELSLLEATNSLKIATVNMNLLLGYSESTLLTIDSAQFNTPVDIQSLDEYLQYALQSRKDLQALVLREKAATSSISIAKADRFPSIAITGGYLAANIPKVLSITNAINGGIALKYNIGSLWTSGAHIKNAKAKVEEINAQQASLVDAVKLQVNRDYENYLLSEQKTKVYEKAVVQAQENFRITKNKYDNNLVNTTELLDANVLLLQSKINLAVSKADIFMAYNKLLQTAGMLTK